MRNFQSKPDCLTLSVEEAGRLLGVGRNKSYDLVRTGEIPAIKLGRNLRVPRQVVVDKLAAAGPQSL
jgi:excisionase family DNA binding protein